MIWGKKAGFGEKSYLRAFARVNPQCQDLIKHYLVIQKFSDPLIFNFCCSC